MINKEVKAIEKIPTSKASILKIEIKKSTREFLEMFEFAPPEMTEENINKHNKLIESLNKNPHETLSHFDLILSETKDDGIRGNLVNLVNKLNLNQREKAEFYVSYIEKMKVGTHEDMIDDNSLSLLIAIDYAIENIAPEEVSSYIQQAISGKNEIVKTTILDRFSAYYPDIVNSFR